MKSIPTRLRAALFITLLLAFSRHGVSAAWSMTGDSPESETARIAKNLRAIPDGEWMKIAGEKITEKYEIMKGDTLWAISGRLFGDPKYWPKVWEINNRSITNPHLIFPGRSILFSSGNGGSLPTVGIYDHHGKLVYEQPGSPYDTDSPRRSEEWKKLPVQPWETLPTVASGGVDKDGFDNRNFVKIDRHTGMYLESIVACSNLERFGEITGGRDDSAYIDVKGEAFIKALKPLKEGEVYSIVAPRNELTSSDRHGVTFSVNGKVKIIGSRDDLFVGEIQTMTGLLGRGNLLIPEQKRVDLDQPIPGSAATLGHLILDDSESSYTTAQHHWVYVDRGETDGVKPGMIFRAFQVRDPRTGRKVTEKNMLVQGDIQIYQTCGGFSVGYVLWSRDTMDNGTPVVLMTDVKDYRKRFYLNGDPGADASVLVPTPPTDSPSNATVAPSDDLKLEGETPNATPSGTPAETPVEATEQPKAEPIKTDSLSPEKDDWLDKLDNGQDLGTDEERELKQLEKYEGSSKAEPLPETAPIEPAPVASPASEFPAITPDAQAQDTLSPTPGGPGTAPNADESQFTLEDAPTEIPSTSAGDAKQAIDGSKTPTKKTAKKKSTKPTGEDIPMDETPL